MQKTISPSHLIAFLLGLFGYYAVAAMMVVKCECAGSEYGTAAGLFAVSSVFLLPSLHAKLTNLTYPWSMRVPFLILCVVWVSLAHSILTRFSSFDLPLPGWNTLSNHMAVLSGLALGLIAFNYLVPGAAYRKLKSCHPTMKEGQGTDEMAQLPPAETT
ncbi:MAG: hypothetical protein AAGK92_03625 [Pseudomonadota bacterium]